jgi:hypothetical protein
MGAPDAMSALGTVGALGTAIIPDTMAYGL